VLKIEKSLKNFHARYSDEDKRKLKELADKQNLKPATYFKKFISDEHRKQFPKQYLEKN
jgi:predicted transcriptional regulator